MAQPPVALNAAIHATVLVAVQPSLHCPPRQPIRFSAITISTTTLAIAITISATSINTTTIAFGSAIALLALVLVIAGACAGTSAFA
jgi:hypothetical protein